MAEQTEFTEPIADALKSPVLRDFKRYKVSVQGRSKKTLDEYLLDLRIFFKFIIADDEGYNTKGEDFYKIDISGCDYAFLSKIDSLMVYDYIEFLTDIRGVSPRSRQRKLSAIKSLYKFAVTTKEIETNPVRDIDVAASRKALPKFLSLQESQDLLKSVSEGGERNRLRDYAIILTFLNTGVRLSELVGINTEDFDKNMTSLMVTGKRNKQRIVYINPAVAEAILAYLDDRREREEEKYGGLLVENGKHPLFVSSHRQRISVKTVQWLVEKHLNAAGLGYKQLSTHKLRHTAATLMYREGGVDIRVLQDILGHEQLGTTQIYTHVASSDVEEGTHKNPLADYHPGDRGVPDGGKKKNDD